ncbi:MAG: hypothetical protein IKC03_09540, partial [Oscillospiraceae bacterium]|nr:hypothetical protein [Oscillospiraceae bacterium]
CRTLQNNRRNQTIRKPYPVANVSPNYHLRVLGIGAATVLLGVMWTISPSYSSKSKEENEDQVIWGIIAAAVVLGIATVIIARKLHEKYVCQTYEVDELIRDPQRVKEFIRDEQEMDAQEIVRGAAIGDSDMDEPTADTPVMETADNVLSRDTSDKEIPEQEEPSMEQQM